MHSSVTDESAGYTTVIVGRLGRLMVTITIRRVGMRRYSLTPLP
jgi:hypothetical protein